MFHSATPKLFRYARYNRDQATLAEKLLWDELRGKKLGGYKIRQQHPVDIYILDFYCHSKRLAIELDGGYHSLPEQLEYDQRRTNQLDAFGIRVIRFSNEKIIHDLPVVLIELKTMLDDIQIPGSSLFIPPGGGV